MSSEGDALRSAKEQVERVLSEGGDVTDTTKSLEVANEAYKRASVAIRKHTTVAKPKAKAKSEAAP